MKRRVFFAASMLAIGLLVPTYGVASTITITLAPGDDDAHVYSNSPTGNYGANPGFVVTKAFDGNGQLTSERQAYLKFSLSALGGYSAADITSVKLGLYVYTTGASTVTAYHTTDNWDEGTITWGNKPAIGGEMGTSPAMTTNNSYYLTDLLAGGPGWLGGDLTDGYLSVALRITSDVGPSSSYYFHSTETNPALAQYPYLQVQVVPEPAAIGMVLLGGILLLPRFGRRNG